MNPTLERQGRARPLQGQGVREETQGRPEEGLPAPLLRKLHEHFGNRAVLIAQQGNADALGELIYALLQTESAGMGAVGPELMSNAAMQRLLAKGPSALAARSPGERLPAEVAARYSASFGEDLSAVRLHTDAAAAQAADARGVRAFALGEDVFFGTRAPGLESPQGQALLGHELAHVVQYRQGRLRGEAAQASAPGSRDTLEQEADGLAGEASATPGADGPAPGWLVDAVAFFSPLLAAVLEHGVVGAFEQQFEAGAQTWLEETMGSTSPEAIADGLVGGLWSVSGLIVGAASGDPACCEAMTMWLAEKVQEADTLLKTGTQLAELAAEQRASWTEALAGLGAFLDGQGLMEALSGIVSSVTGQVDELLVGLSSLDATLGAQVAESLGLEQATLSALVQRGLQVMFAEVGRIVAEVKEGLLAALFSLPGLEELYQLADFAVEMKQGATWLAEHWQDADLWEQAELLKEHLPRFAELLQTAGSWWKGLNDSLQTQLSAATARIDGWCTTLWGVPLLSVVAHTVTRLVEGAQRVLASPVWGEIAEASQAGAAFAGTVLGELLELAKVVSAAMLFPPQLIFVLAGTAVKVLPECYLPPVFDLLVTIAALGVSTAMGPLVAELPALAPGWQASLLGILEGLRGLPVARKQAVLLGFAELLQQGFSDVLYGFGAGLLCGLWDEVCFWFDVAYWLSGVGIAQSVLGLAGDLNSLSALWEALSLLDRLGDAHREGPEEEAPEPTPEPPAVAPIEQPQDWPSLEAWMGGLVDGFTQLVSQVWASVVESIVVPLLEKALTEGAWALGYGGGYALSFFVVEAALAFVTGGLAGAVTLGRGALAALKLAVKGGLAAMPEIVRATRAVLSWGDDLLALLRKIPGLEGLIGWLDELWASAKKWLDELVGGADEVPKTPDSPDGQKPKPPQDPDKTPDGDEHSETAEAMRVWEKLSEATSKHLLSKAQLQKEATTIASVDKDIRSIEIDDKAATHTWEADLVLTDGDRAQTRDGWIAYDTQKQPFYGNRDVREDNQDIADEALDELEKRWAALFSDQPPRDAEAARTALQAAAKDQVAPRHASRLAFAAEVSLSIEVAADVRIDQGRAEVTASVLVSPNSLEKKRRLSSTPSVDLVERFEQDLNRMHPDARPDFVKGLQTLARSVRDNPPATFEAACTLMREDTSNPYTRLWCTPLNTGRAFTSRAVGTVDAALSRAIEALAAQGTFKGLPANEAERTKFLGSRKGQIHGGQILGVLDELRHQMHRAVTDEEATSAMVPPLQQVLEQSCERITLLERYTEAGDPALAQIHPQALTDVHRGLAQLDKKAVQPPTFADAFHRMKGESDNAVARLWKVPLNDEVKFSPYGMGQADTALQQAAQQASMKPGTTAPATDEERHAWIDHHKASIHGAAKLFPKSLAALRAEIEDQGQDGGTVPVFVPEFQKALQEDRPPPDYNAILQIYEDVANKAGVTFNKSAWQATRSGTDAAREKLRTAVVAAYAPGGKGLVALNRDLLSTSNPIPPSQNGLKGSIFEHWTHAYHRDTLLSGKERPYFFDVVLNGEAHEVCADGCLDGTDILVECKAVQVHKDPDTGETWADPPTDDELIDQMKRYAVILTDNTDKHKWKDKDGNIYKFNKVRYVFACQEAIDAWDPVLAKYLTFQGQALYETAIA